MSRFSLRLVVLVLLLPLPEDLTIQRLRQLLDIPALLGQANETEQNQLILGHLISMEYSFGHTPVKRKKTWFSSHASFFRLLRPILGAAMPLPAVVRRLANHAAHRLLLHRTHRGLGGRGAIHEGQRPLLNPDKLNHRRHLVLKPYSSGPTAFKINKGDIAAASLSNLVQWIFHLNEHL